MTGGTRRGMRIDQILSNFGYCSRREAAIWVRGGRVEVDGRVVDDASERVEPVRVRVDGEAVEGPTGLLALLHKPAGVVCSRSDGEGPGVYGLLPERWSRRHPPVTTVGRLDKDTTGLLLVTDLGEWVHRWTSPKHHVEKTYEVVLDGPGEAAWVDLFESGTLVLEGEEKPCLPARLEWVGPHEARLHLVEGRFHQVKRMFSAVGREVVHLHRSRFGTYELGDLPVGAWRFEEFPQQPGLPGIPARTPGSAGRSPGAG
ncbi:MAG: pseudouridine synthase [Limisphaerales bacterium]